MDVSVEGKKVVVYDIIGAHSRENRCFDKNVAGEPWYDYSGIYLYEECLKRGIQLVTPGCVSFLVKEAEGDLRSRA